MADKINPASFTQLLKAGGDLDTRKQKLTQKEHVTSNRKSLAQYKCYSGKGHGSKAWNTLK